MRLPVVLAVSLLCLLACQSMPLSMGMTCGSLADQVEAISQDQGCGPNVLQTYGVEETGRSTDRLDCRARALWTRGEGDVVFYLRQDQDGAYFVGYQRER